MVDGGVLDNKPFTHVTRAIEHKPAEHEIYRVVAYVEPDPEAIPEHSGDPAIPKPLQVAANLYGLFRHEPIHEDLCRLRDRNEKVADLKALLDANKEHARQAAIHAGTRGASNGRRCRPTLTNGARRPTPMLPQRPSPDIRATSYSRPAPPPTC